MAGGHVLQIAEKPLGRSRCELQLEGELDLWSVERLQAALERMARDNEALLVGLERCTFVDSTGIALFLQARRQLEDAGGRLAIYGCSDQVARIFEIAGLADAGIVFASRAEAVAALVGAE